MGRKLSKKQIDILIVMLTRQRDFPGRGCEVRDLLWKASGSSPWWGPQRAMEPRILNSLFKGGLIKKKKKRRYRKMTDYLFLTREGAYLAKEFSAAQRLLKQIGQMRTIVSEL